MTKQELHSENHWILLGASRGLGAAFSEKLGECQASYSCFSRKINGFDAHKKEEWNHWIEKWSLLSPTHLIFFIGGGPHGAFGTKDLKDHEWAFRVNFEFPSFLLHRILSTGEFTNLRQICFVGSAIAEGKPDPLAASYAAAKHALKGLVTSIQREPHGTLDLRLFSPGYMDTGLLPANAWPRQRAGMIKSPHEMALKLWKWLQDSTCANQHQVFE